MKTFIGILLAGLLAGCASLPKVYTNHGVIFPTDIGIKVFQGADDNGILLATVQVNQGVWVYVPSGFEMFTGEFSNGRGGDATVSLDASAQHSYFFELNQKPGYITPDVTLKQVSPSNIKEPSAKKGMAAVYFFYNPVIQLGKKRQ